METKDIKKIVREGYGRIARAESSCCIPKPAESSCCAPAVGELKETVLFTSFINSAHQRMQMKAPN